MTARLTPFLNREIWKEGAEPTDGTTRSSIAASTPEGPLREDVEGLSLAYGRDGTGYLVTWSQGDNSYAVYRREGRNSYVENLTTVRGNRIDGTQWTDGVDITTAHLGPMFSCGVFVAPDRSNDDGEQNFQRCSYDDVLPVSP